MGELFDSMRRAKLGGRQPALVNVFAVLDPQDREDLRAALDNPTIPAQAIREALLKRGHDISTSIVYRYRAGNYDYVLK